MLYAVEISAVRQAVAEARARGKTIGLVPTMGALHEGHLSLVRRARQENGFVVVSVFVNPTQFGPHEDLDTYPRDLERDRELCAREGVDLIFSPTPEIMYPISYSTWVEVEKLTTGLCGRSRPGHFRGVCTVVAKLFNICQPDRAYFGQKDAQQLAVVQRMTRDLNWPITIVPCPTVRESDGLALSSRNQRLTPEARAQATVLYRALATGERLIEEGERRTETLKQAMSEVLAEAPLAEVDYLEVVRADDLTPVTLVRGECLLAVAARFGDVRLIDNIRVSA